MSKMNVNRLSEKNLISLSEVLDSIKQCRRRKNYIQAIDVLLQMLRDFEDDDDFYEALKNLLEETTNEYRRHLASKKKLN
jgi:predicted DNA-binding protein YlxM (UPF0122 family)